MIKVLILLPLLAGCHHIEPICTDKMAEVHKKLPQVYKHCKETIR